MFRRHVTTQLSAFAHGELSPADSQRVAAHLRDCEHCRQAYEEIKLGVRLAESLTLRTAPAALWEKIESALPPQTSAASSAASSSAGATSHHTAPLEPKRGWFPFALNHQLFAGAAAVLVFTLGLGAWWFDGTSTRAAWEVARLSGAPTIDADRISATGRLGVGEWLETDEASRAKIEVADIGQVEIDPGTRVRLVETSVSEHRLELARGRMHATIWAPPRLFFVDTPSAVAADLGCAYTLEVDERGRGLLHVTSGWVALETPVRESFVPAGGACLTEPGTGPGTPFFVDASETFRRALSRFDFEHDGGAAESLDIILAESRTRDTLTLWHLLSRTDDAERRRVYERLAQLDAPPVSVTRDGALRLDQAMLGAWKDQLELSW
ncbi:MAG: FecR domain-containing protein [Acidobacteriota bacterium]|nr:FecR domain-containing protein [Acidobacteriota bacterium]